MSFEKDLISEDFQFPLWDTYKSIILYFSTENFLSIPFMGY